jgi:acetyl-CoA synthetase
MAEATLEAQLEELLDQETFSPSSEFASHAVISDSEIHEKAKQDPEGFWAEQAEALDWDEKWTQVLDWSNPPFAKWFVGGKLNVAYNCVDRHVEAGLGERVAFHWRGEEGEERDITYADLHRDVQRFANALKERGIEKGDVVGIYLPMIPEVAVAMLACARIGAPHNVVFGGFSPESVKERMEFSEAKALITVDGARRKGRTAPIKQQVDEVMAGLEHLETIIVVQHTNTECSMRRGATSGGTPSWRPPPTSARPSRWTPSTRSTSSTRAARRRSRRGSCTRPAATSLRSPGPTATSSTSSPTRTSSGARPTSAG